MSDFVSLTVANDEKIISQLKRLPSVMRPTAVEEMTKYLVEYGGGNSMRWYPPARAGSKYVRTFNLMRSWKYESDDSRGYISTDVPYAPFPMGNPPAAKMRLRGWRGAMERVTANLGKAVSYARQKVMAKVRALGL